MFCQNAGTDGRVMDIGIHLLPGKMPEVVDLFALQKAGGNMAAQRTVTEAGEQSHMPKGVIAADSIIIVRMQSS